MHQADTYRAIIRGGPLFMFVMIFSLAQNSKASIYLVGAQLYRTNLAGQDSSDPYQFSTNSSTSHTALVINGGSGLNLSVLMQDGTNSFTFSPPVGQIDSPGQYAGLNLFFNTTGVPFNPPAASVVPGDLTVHAFSDGLSPPLPTSFGTTVLSYGTSGSVTSGAFANGAASMILDGHSISVTAFSVDKVPSGSFTVLASPVPEPSSELLLLLGGLVFALILLFRRSGGTKPITN